MEWFQSLMLDIPVSWKLFFLSMLPITELRASIPLAILGWGVLPYEAWIIAVTGNILPSIPLLLLLGPITHFLDRYTLLNKIFNYILSRTRARGARIEKYGALGVLIFVAVPFPGSGVWAGSILAFLLGLRFTYAFAAITGGVFVAATLVTLGSMGFLKALSIFYG